MACTRGTQGDASHELTLEPSAVDAARTMACDFTPRMLPAFKLATMTTRRPCISASGMCFTRPLTTYRQVPCPSASVEESHSHLLCHRFLSSTHSSLYRTQLENNVHMYLGCIKSMPQINTIHAQ